MNKKLFTAFTFCSAMSLQGCDLVRELPFGNGFVAKNMCSGLFVSGIDEDLLRDRYVGPTVEPLNLLWDIEIDRDNGLVSSSDIIFKDRFKQTAYYREGLGCTLLHDQTTDYLDSQIPQTLATQDIPPYLFWPHGSAGVWPIERPNIDYNRIQAAIDDAFVETPEQTRQTVAVLAVYDNQLIAEQYGGGVNKDTRLVGWSMAKSFTSTFIGLLQDRGLLNSSDLAPVDAWKETDKESITIENLLHMASGLKYSEESTGPNNDQSYTVHAMEVFADFLLDRPLVAEPGTTYNYSTAETMLLGKIAHDALGGSLEGTHHFLNENLFQPLGITNPILEYDTHGNPGSSTYLMLTPRDWLRLGSLYLNRGNWFGHQIVSESWIDYSLTPSPANPTYGTQIWLNTDRELWPSLPEDAFAFLGYQKQKVIMVPSKNLAVLRMGFTFEKDIDETEKLVYEIINSLPSDET